MYELWEFHNLGRAMTIPEELFIKDVSNWMKHLHRTDTPLLYWGLSYQPERGEVIEADFKVITPESHQLSESTELVAP